MADLRVIAVRAIEASKKYKRERDAALEQVRELREQSAEDGRDVNSLTDETIGLHKELARVNAARENDLVMLEDALQRLQSAQSEIERLVEQQLNLAVQNTSLTYEVERLRVRVKALTQQVQNLTNSGVNFHYHMGFDPAPAPSIPQDKIMALIKLVHPDKHAGTPNEQTATELTQMLPALRKR